MLKPTYSHSDAMTIAGMTRLGSDSHCCSRPQPISACSNLLNSP